MRRGHDLFIFIFVLGKCYEIKRDTKKNNIALRPSLLYLLYYVKIVGGKRAEIQVDKYGIPLNQKKKTNQPATNFQTKQHGAKSPFCLGACAYHV